MKSFGGAVGANATTTGTVKDADAATRAWAAANPKATPQGIADYKANLIAGGMGGSDLEQRQYLQEKSSGITTDDFATWKAKKGAQAYDVEPASQGPRRNWRGRRWRRGIIRRLTPSWQLCSLTSIP